MNKTIYTHLFALLAVGMLAGCAGTATRPAPVEDRGQPAGKTLPEPLPSTPGEAEITAYRLPQPPQTARPQPAKAVQVLLQRASDQRRAGDLLAAAGSLERALRIEPRNPLLWNQLAHVRLDQQQYRLAADLAAKSNSFAGAADGALKRDNAAVIDRARRGNP